MVWSTCILFKPLCTPRQMWRNTINWIFWVHLWHCSRPTIHPRRLTGDYCLTGLETSKHSIGQRIQTWNRVNFTISPSKQRRIQGVRGAQAPLPCPTTASKSFTNSDRITPISDSLVITFFYTITWVTLLPSMCLTDYTPQKRTCTTLVFLLWKWSRANQTSVVQIKISFTRWQLFVPPVAQNHRFRS